MIARLTGVATTQGPSLILDVHDVGYAVFVCPTTLLKVASGKTYTLEICTLMKQESLTLYGFMTLEEKQLFELLLSVSGVGPKTALQVIDRGVNQVVSAVQQADVSFFTSVPRLGKKNAQKIIIELTTKLGEGLELALGESPLIHSEAGQALQALGYDDKSIAIALDGLASEGLSTQDVVKQALKKMHQT